MKLRFTLSERTVFLSVAMLLLAILVSMRASDPSPVQGLRHAYFDYLQRLQPRTYTPLPVVIVDLDEASLQQVGQWPWPRDRLAAMVDRLADLGAAVIVFDILFPEADRLSPRNLVKDAAVRNALSGGPWLDRIDRLDNDVAFAGAIGRTSVVLGIADAGERSGAIVDAKAGFAFVGQSPGSALLPLRSATAIVPVLADAASGIGVINVNPLEENDTIREVPMAWRTRDGFVPSLAVEALRVALGASTIVVTGSTDGPNRVDDIRVGDYRIPTGASGLLRVRFRHDEAAQYIPAFQLLNDETRADLAASIDGSIVFVGASAAGLSDTRTTALGERVPGVSIHAQILEQILSESYLIRNDITEGVEVIVLVLLGLLVSLALMLAGPVLSFAAGASAAIATLAASWYAFAKFGILFDATFPLIGGFSAFSLLAMYRFVMSDHEKRRIHRSLAHYVAPSVLQEMNRKGYSIELGGRIGEVTVLFCDIRDFTPLAATMSAQDLVSLLNELFTDLSEAILAQAGTIDKYIGDEIMAFWNAPLAMDRHQHKACMATLGMRGALQAYNARKAVNGTAPLAIGMGMDCGPACVGNIGSLNRFNYTAIGETVNVAARTQAACRHVGYDILVTGDVARSASTLAFLPAGRIELKGVAERVETFVLVGDETVAVSAAFCKVKDAYGSMLAAMTRHLPVSPQANSSLMILAERLDPRLASFVDRAMCRPDDFRDIA